jgi:triacylglycerol esterase/lipase EstA (alpha/beta hydrolase family)
MRTEPSTAGLLAQSRPAHNPHFPLTVAQARRELARMRREPARAARPIVVLSGYHSPHAQAEHLRWVLQRHTSADTALVAVSYTTVTNMPAIVDVARRAIAKWTHGLAGAPEQVDLVGISMGGLIARAVTTGAPLVSTAGPVTRAQPVPAARVFTLASPHRGAKLADKITPNTAALDMKRGSRFLTSLDEAQAGAAYELVCYSRLRDGWVGARRSAPPGHGVIWTSGALWGSHFTVTWDPRIICDLCRRLRGEEPLGTPSEPPRD